jgi:hypothetical protein
MATPTPIGTTTKLTSAGTSSLSGSHTVPSGTTTLAICISLSKGADSISGVSWNGNALTRAVASISNVGSYIYLLPNPTPGTGSAVISLSNGTDRAIVATVINLSNTPTSSVTGASQGTGAGTTSTTGPLTTTSANSIILDCVTEIANSALTPGSGQTAITNQFQSGTSQDETAGVSYKATTSIGSYSTGWSNAGSSTQWNYCSIEIKGTPSTDVTVTASVATATFSLPAPTFTNATSITASASAAVSSFSIPAPTITAVKNVAAAAAVLTLAFSFGGSATSSGPAYPGTVFDNGTGAPYFGDGNWTNPDNVKAADASVATGVTSHSGFSITNALTLTDFGFSVPASASVTGIQVEINRKGTNAFDGGINDEKVQLVIGGTPSGDDKASVSPWPSTLTVASYGGQSDLWGLSLSAADVNASNFGLIVQGDELNATGQTASIDYARITVYYTGGFSVITTSNVTVAPAVLSVTSSAPAPAVLLDYTTSVTALALTASLPQPQVLTAITPDILTLTFSVPSPSVEAVQNVSTTATVLSVSFSAPDPAVGAGTTASASVATIAFSVQAPTLSTTSNATVTPSAAVLTFSAQTPTLDFDYVVSATPAVAAWTVNAVLVQADGSIVVAPSTLSLVVSVQTPALSFDFVVKPTVAAATISLVPPTISFSSNVSIQPTVLSLTASAPSASVALGQTVNVSVLSLTTSAPAPFIGLSSQLSATAFSLTFSIVAPVRIGGLWTNEEHASSSWDNEARPSTAMINDARPTTTWNNDERAAA